MNLYPGDVIKVKETGFNGLICPIDEVSSDYVRLALDGVFGNKRWIKKHNVELARRPIQNSIRDASAKCFISIWVSMQRLTSKLKEK